MPTASLILETHVYALRDGGTDGHTFHMDIVAEPPLVPVLLKPAIMAFRIRLDDCVPAREMPLTGIVTMWQWLGPSTIRCIWCLVNPPKHLVAWILPQSSPL